MELPAEKREPGTATALRRAERLPGIVYNSEINQPISVNMRAFDKAFRAQGTSSLIDLVIDGETHSVLVKQVQMDKRRRVPMHVDFYAITAGQVVEVNIPIEFIGTPAGVRDGGGMIDVQRREVNISVLPSLIPNHLVLDISALMIGDSLHVQNLVELLPPEAEILDDLELALVALVPPRVAEEEEETEAEESVEPEVIGEETDDEEESADD